MAEKGQTIEVFAEATEDDVPSIRRVIKLSDLEGKDGVGEIRDLTREKILWGVYGDYGALLKVTEMREVEPLEPTDENVAGFRKLYEKGLLEEPSSFGSTYEIEHRKSDEEVRKFLQDNHVVGVKYGFTDSTGQRKDRMVAIGQYKRLEGVKSHIATVGKMYVHPAHRKRAIAGSIMRHFLQRAEADGVEQVHLVVTASNVFAVKFYEKLGFVPGQMQYNAVKIEGQYYDWLPMRLSMQEYKSGKFRTPPRRP